MRRTALNLSQKSRDSLDRIVAEDDCLASVVYNRAIQVYAGLRDFYGKGYKIVAVAPDGTASTIIIL